MQGNKQMIMLPKILGLNYVEIAEKIGLKRADNLRNIASGRKKTGIDKKLANMLINSFPELNINWLLFEEGNPTIKKLQDTTDEVNEVNEVNEPFEKYESNDLVGAVNKLLNIVDRLTLINEKNTDNLSILIKKIK